MSKAFLDVVADIEGAGRPTFRDEATLRDELQVDLRLGVPASGLALPA